MMLKRNRRQQNTATGSKASSAAALANGSLPDSSTTRRRRVTRRKHVFVVIAAGLLLTVGALGAATFNIISSDSSANVEEISVDKKSSSSLFGILTAGQPLPTPTPYLERQNIYAGGKLVAVETAGVAPNTSPTASDLVVWRVSSGVWMIKDGADGTTSTNQFGMSGDVPIPADFDGDNLADFCVFRPNTPTSGAATWYIQPNGGTGFSGWQWGGASGNQSTDDRPTPADFDGDGKADIAVWRLSDKTYYILLSSSNTLLTIQMTELPGASAQVADKPVPQDYDGDGMADAAVWQNSSGNWFIIYAATGQAQTVQFGAAGDSPAPGDYDGDGKFDQSVWRPGNNTWYYRSSMNNNQTIFSQVLVTQAGDRAVQGDYDGDGKTDMAVWRPANGTWYIQKSRTNTLQTTQWGQAGDFPVPAPMKR